MFQRETCGTAVVAGETNTGPSASLRMTHLKGFVLSEAAADGNADLSTTLRSGRDDKGSAGFIRDNNSVLVVAWTT